MSGTNRSHRTRLKQWHIVCSARQPSAAQCCIVLGALQHSTGQYYELLWVLWDTIALWLNYGSATVFQMLASDCSRRKRALALALRWFSASLAPGGIGMLSYTYALRSEGGVVYTSTPLFRLWNVPPNSVWKCWEYGMSDAWMDVGAGAADWVLYIHCKGHGVYARK
ncbi:hypothetical protein B0H13DRAFT_2488217 [Mycena leptocephala]|nr:hypothetical protein B0H13DRAFT_2488217 [Mycena leptocephala]